MTRKTIPPTVRDLILMEAGYKCANPTCRHILTLELHHIVWVRDDGGNEPDNLLALCPNCHSLHTHGHIPEMTIRTWKSLLVSLNSSNRAAADLLLVLREDEMRFDNADDPAFAPRPFQFTGDGLPAIAGLITSGLLEISKRNSNVSARSVSMPSFEVRLTAKGKQFVEAWIDGDASRLAQVIDSDLLTT